jgi:hypothetical protein
MVVSELTVKLVAGTLPKLTTLAPEKCVPDIVRTVPPPTGPDVTLSPVTVGGGK